MKQKEIKYIGFYNPPYSKTKRAGALSAINKMDYIATAIHEAGFEVHLVSPSWMGTEPENPYFESIDIDTPADWDFAVIAKKYMQEKMNSTA